MAKLTLCEHHIFDYARPEALEHCVRCGEALLPGDWARSCRKCRAWCHYDDSPKCDVAYPHTEDVADG